MRFKVNVTCDPNKIETVNCYKIVPESRFELNYGNEQ
jgi:hypothetical protein